MLHPPLADARQRIPSFIAGDRPIRIAPSAKITDAMRHPVLTIVTVSRFGIYLRRVWMLSRAEACVRELARPLASGRQLKPNDLR